MAVFQIQYFSGALGRIAPLTAIVPCERFGPATAEPEPLRSLYLLHGYNGTNTDWLNGSIVAELAQKHRMAIFMPAGENSFYLDDKIRNANYAQMVCEELITFTRSAFPLSHRREDTYLGGFSMGGYGALRNGLLRGDVFGAVIALSSAIMTDQLANMKPEADDAPKGRRSIAPYSYYAHTFGPLDQFAGSDKDPKALAKAIIDEGRPKPYLYMACGTEDFGIQGNRDFSAYLDSIGFEHEFKYSTGIHNWTFWNEYIEKAMDWLETLYK